MKKTAAIIIIILVAVIAGMYFLKKDSNSIQYEFVTSTDGKNQIPQIINYPNERIMYMVNTAIFDWIDGQSCDIYLNEEDKARYPDAGIYLITQVESARDNRFSVTIRNNKEGGTSAGNCGGVLWDDYPQTRTYDLESGLLTETLPSSRQ